MPLNNLKLIALLMLALIMFACAHQEPLQLPPPVAVDSEKGWHSY